MENRREFIKNGLAVVLGAAGTLAAAGGAGAFPPSEGNRWGMVIDTSRCSGCQSCMVACKLQHNTVEGAFSTTVRGRETGVYPGANFYFQAEICRHCSDAPCVSACGTGAAFVHGSGLVLTDWGRCDGSGACIDACPYNARFHDARFGGKSDKCDLCLDRIFQGLTPACVENCSSGARIFGRLDKPEGELARYLSQLTPEAGNASAVIVFPYNGQKEER